MVEAGKTEATKREPRSLISCETAEGSGGRRDEMRNESRVDIVREICSSTII